MTTIALKYKIIIAVVSMLITGAISFIIYNQLQISARQIAIETEMVRQKELVDNITRSSQQYATRDDIEKLITDNKLNLKAIQEDLKVLHAEITAVNIVKVNSLGSNGNNVGSTTTGPISPITSKPPEMVSCSGKKVDCNTIDTHGYRLTQQNLTLSEEFSNVKVPFGTVGFSAWQEKPWSYKVSPRGYRLTQVVGTDEYQRNYFYNKFVISVDNQDYEVKINQAATTQVYPEPKFSFWNPRLNLGLDSGINTAMMNGEFTPSANISFMSYGQYKTTPDWSFLQAGLGYSSNKHVEFIFTPFTYNVGKHLPLMNNLYLGPSIQMNALGNVSIMGGLRVNL